MTRRPRYDTSEQARDYLDLGWAVVPVQPEDKSPKIKDWPELAADREFEPYEFEGHNVGVVLGPVSGGLVDVDLDSRAALELAEYFLPRTRTFGRKSKRASHWLYYADGARSDQLKFGPKDRRELVEIRAQNRLDDGCGHQSVFPGSTHESGERIEWDNDEEIARVDAGELAWAVARLAVASVVYDGWVEGGGRNVKSMGITGGLLKMGWKADEVRDLMRAVREASGLDREDDRRAVENTIKNFEAGQEVTGFGALTTDGDLPLHDLDAIKKHARTPTQRSIDASLAMSRLGRHGAQAALINEARAVDGMTEEANAAATTRHEVHRRTTGDDDFGCLGREIDLSKKPRLVRYICKGLGLAPGKISGLAGYGGTGKGPLLQYMALCVAAGLPIFGHQVERQRVFYTDFETGEVLAHRRFARLARAMGLDLAQLQKDRWILFVDSSGKRISDPWLDDIDEVIDKLKVGLLCIDSYSSAVPGDQNESMYADVAWALGDISNRRGVTVLTVLHENKGAGGRRGDDDARNLAGTGILFAALQGLISVVRPDPKFKMRYELRSTRGPEGGGAPVTIEWHDIEAPNGRLERWALLEQGEDPAKWGLEPRVVEGAELAETQQSKDAQRDARELEIAERVCAYLTEAETGGKNLSRIRSSVRGSNTEIKNVVAGLTDAGVLNRLPGDYYELADETPRNYEARLRWGLVRKKGS